MGLDMYLMGKKYCGGYDFSDKKEKDTRKMALKAFGLPEFIEEKGAFVEISVRLAYWRKANAIHGWFVREVQEGKDDCGDYYIEREKLEELINICETILETRDPVIALKLLPPVGGFFFGRTEIGEYFFNDLQDTIAQLKPILQDEKFKQFELYYHSSW